MPSFAPVICACTRAQSTEHAGLTDGVRKALHVLGDALVRVRQACRGTNKVSKANRHAGLQACQQHASCGSDAQWRGPKKRPLRQARTAQRGGYIVRVVLHVGCVQVVRELPHEGQLDALLREEWACGQHCVTHCSMEWSGQQLQAHCTLWPCGCTSFPSRQPSTQPAPACT